MIPLQERKRNEIFHPNKNQVTEHKSRHCHTQTKQTKSYRSGASYSSALVASLLTSQFTEKGGCHTPPPPNEVTVGETYLLRIEKTPVLSLSSFNTNAHIASASAPLTLVDNTQIYISLRTYPRAQPSSCCCCWPKKSSIDSYNTSIIAQVRPHH